MGGSYRRSCDQDEIEVFNTRTSYMQEVYCQHFRKGTFRACGNISQTQGEILHFPWEDRGETGKQYCQMNRSRGNEKFEI